MSKTTKEKIEVMKAFSEGKRIEMTSLHGWRDIEFPAWNWLEYNYRIKEGPICVNEMKDGEIAVIIEWDSVIKNIGKVVMRYGDDLYPIGGKEGDVWPNMFGANRNEKLRVRVLNKEKCLNALKEVCDNL